MHDHARFFVDDHNVFILINDIQIRLDFQKGILGFDRVKKQIVIYIKLQHITCRKLVGYFLFFSVDLDFLFSDAFINQRIRRKFQHLFDKLVQPEPVVVLVCGKFSHRNQVCSFLRMVFHILSQLFCLCKLFCINLSVLTKNIDKNITNFLKTLEKFSHLLYNVRWLKSSRKFN